MTRQIVGACSFSVAFAAAALAQTPAGGEFRVNTYTPGNQSVSGLATRPNGEFVVAFSNSSQGAFLRLYDASGMPHGAEFRVSDTSASQGLPDVAVSRNGDLVAVWESTLDGSGTSIQGALFDSAGDPVGAEFMVNTFTTGYQYSPRVGRSADGGFVVTWASFGPDGGGWGVAARRFDASGAAIGDEFVVNTYTTGSQLVGDLAVASNGEFVIVWEDAFGDRDGSSSAVFGQRFDASGSRLGGEFQANGTTAGRQGYPSISASPSGGFVVAWLDDSADGSGLGVFARQFARSGDPIGDDFQVNTYTPGEQYGGSIAHDARGNFVVTWVSSGQDGSSYGIFAQGFGPSGARRGEEFRVNTYTTGSQDRPLIASDPAGDLVIAWDSRGQDGSGRGVFAQRFTATRGAQ